MNRTEKAAVIDEVAEQITESEAVFALDYRGISVPQGAELRAKLRDNDTTFRVVKNSLTERAADKAGVEGIKDFLTGPTAMTFVRGDAALAAKTLTDFHKAEQVLTFKGGWMNGEILSATEIEAIAKLPAREVLYARLTGMVASPLTGLVTGLGGLISGLGRQLQQIADQGLVPSAGAAPAVAADAGGAEAPAEAAKANKAEANAQAGEAAKENANAEPSGQADESGPDSEPNSESEQTQASSGSESKAATETD